MSVTYRLASIMGIALFCTVAFFGLSASAFAATTTSHPAASHAAPRRGCPMNVNPGDHGSAVRQLQIDLKNRGFKDSRGHNLDINGRYDGNTLYAAKRFEARHHLQQNGRIDAREWQLLGECGH